MMTLRVPLLSIAPVLAACSTTHEFRVASVGNGSGSPATAQTSAPHQAAVMVASGNVLLGRTGQLLPTSGSPIVNGRVAGVLASTGQTLVSLGGTTTVLINGVGGTLGDAVSINLAQGKVIGGPTALIGGQLAGTSAATTSLLGAATGRTSATSLLSNAGKTLGATTGTSAVTQTAGTTLGTVAGPITHICC